MDSKEVPSGLNVGLPPPVAFAAAIGRPDPYAGEVPIAYVQLKSGRSATPSELMEFAQSCIPERAAWPKAIHVVDRLPMTNVGKIFKPNLQQREIEDIIRAEAAAVGAELTDVRFGTDSARGIVACATAVGGGPTPLRSALAKYAFAVEVLPEQK